MEEPNLSPFFNSLFIPEFSNQKIVSNPIPNLITNTLKDTTRFALKDQELSSYDNYKNVFQDFIDDLPNLIRKDSKNQRKSQWDLLFKDMHKIAYELNQSSSEVSTKEKESYEEKTVKNANFFDKNKYYSGFESTKEMNNLFEKNEFILHDLPICSFDMDPTVYTSSEEEDNYIAEPTYSSFSIKRFPSYIQSLRSTLRQAYKHCRKLSPSLSAFNSTDNSSPMSLSKNSAFSDNSNKYDTYKSTKTESMVNERVKYRIYRRAMLRALKKIENIKSTKKMPETTLSKDNSFVNILKNEYLPLLQYGCSNEISNKSWLSTFLSNIMNQNNSFISSQQLNNSQLTFLKPFTFQFQKDFKFYICNVNNCINALHNSSYQSINFMEDSLFWFNILTSGFYPLYLDGNYHKKCKSMNKNSVPEDSIKKDIKTGNKAKFAFSSQNNDNNLSSSLSIRSKQSPSEFPNSRLYSQIQVSKAALNMDIDRDSSESEIEKIEIQWQKKHPLSNSNFITNSNKRRYTSSMILDSSLSSIYNNSISTDRIDRDINKDTDNRNLKNNNEINKNRGSKNNDFMKNVNILDHVEEQINGRISKKLVDYIEADNKWNTTAPRKRLFNNINNFCEYINSNSDEICNPWDDFSSSENSDIVYFRNDSEFRYRKQLEKIAREIRYNRETTPSFLDTMTSKLNNLKKDVLIIEPNNNCYVNNKSHKYVYKKKKPFKKENFNLSLSPQNYSNNYNIHFQNKRINQKPIKKITDETLLKSFKKIFRKSRVQNFDVKHFIHNPIFRYLPFGLVATGMDMRGVHTQCIGIDQLSIHNHFKYNKFYAKHFMNNFPNFSTRNEYIAIIDEETNIITIYNCGTLQIYILPTPQQNMIDKTYKNMLYKPIHIRWREFLIFKQLNYVRTKQIDAFMSKDEVKSFQQSFIELIRHGLSTFYKESVVNELELAHKLKSLNNIFNENNKKNSEILQFKKLFNEMDWLCLFNNSQSKDNIILLDIKDMYQYKQTISPWRWVYKNFKYLLIQAITDIYYLNNYKQHIFPIFIKKYWELRHRFSKNSSNSNEKNSANYSLSRTKEINAATQIDESLVNKQLEKLKIDKKENLFKSDLFEKQSNIDTDTQWIIDSLPKFNTSATNIDGIYNPLDILPFDVLSDSLLTSYPFEKLLNNENIEENIEEYWTPVICFITKQLSKSKLHIEKLLFSFEFSHIAKIIKILQWLIALCKSKDKIFDKDDQIDYIILSKIAKATKSNISNIKNKFQIPSSFISWIKARFFSQDQNQNYFMTRYDQTRLISSIVWICAFLSPEWTFDYESLVIQEWENKMTQKFINICLMMGFSKAKSQDSKYKYSLTNIPSFIGQTKSNYTQFNNLFSNKPSNYSSSFSFQKRV